ncbi:CBS domain-containing protein [Candidatus Nitronereus thalassa]|uniref:CBS domain-containing protein n=1 Tax=Candidatus Nitronereus thalassa TaxID=3020898 RepID=A0ABU3K5V4_9BACT|nr:CBS domain-containing protein [Candidatus Nitronereus thalassa]MDT7041761.1 CBS domain-containing protein [Candidatus Nitronereus thalassa]
MRVEDQLTLKFIQLHPVESSRQLERLDSQTAAGMLTSLPVSDVSTVLGCCQPSLAARILEHVTVEQATGVVSELPASTAYVVFRQLSPELQNQMIERLGPVHGPRFRRALIQPRQTAGSLADPRVVTLPPDVTVAQGIQLLKRNPRQALYYVYVVDRDAKLEGVVTLKQLLMVDPEDYIATVMNDQVFSLPASLTNDELVGHPHWQQHPTLPVVDQDGVFLGVLRYRTLQQVIEEMQSRRDPGNLPSALIQLWEAYSLAGIGLLTELSQAMTSVPQTPSGSQNTEHQG